MEGHVVTTNPWLVMAINMSVVFGVLIALGFIMKIIYWIDPTRKREKANASAEAVTSTSVALAPVVDAPASSNQEEVIAAIIGAVIAMGYSSDQIASIRPTTSAQWRLEGRLSSRR